MTNIEIKRSFKKKLFVKVDANGVITTKIEVGDPSMVVDKSAIEITKDPEAENLVVGECKIIKNKVVRRPESELDAVRKNKIVKTSA